MANNKSKAVETPEVDVQDIVQPEPEKIETVKKAEPKVRKELPADLYVPCVSMIRTGKLVYVSKRQIGFEAIWRRFMDVQYIDLKELMAMRSTDVSFFAENQLTRQKTEVFIAAPGSKWAQQLFFTASPINMG